MPPHPRQLVSFCTPDIPLSETSPVPSHKKPQIFKQLPKLLSILSQVGAKSVVLCAWIKIFSSSLIMEKSLQTTLKPVFSPPTLTALELPTATIPTLTLKMETDAKVVKFTREIFTKEDGIANNKLSRRKIINAANITDSELGEIKKRKVSTKLVRSISCTRLPIWAQQVCLTRKEANIAETTVEKKIQRQEHKPSGV